MNIFKPQTPFTGIKQTDLAQAWQQNRETLNAKPRFRPIPRNNRWSKQRGANCYARHHKLALQNKPIQRKGKAQRTLGSEEI